MRLDLAAHEMVRSRSSDGYAVSCTCGAWSSVARTSRDARDLFRQSHVAELRMAARTICRVCLTPKSTCEFPRRSDAGQICKPCRRERMRRWITDNRRRYQDRQLDHHLRKTYGITIEDYNVLLATVAGRCHICLDFPANGVRLHVDHDHVTGKIRGLLCFRCNAGLGSFRDDISLLARAARYIGFTRAIASPVPRRAGVARAAAGRERCGDGAAESAGRP